MNREKANNLINKKTKETEELFKKYDNLKWWQLVSKSKIKTRCNKLVGQIALADAMSEY